MRLILHRMGEVWQHSGSFVIRFGPATDPRSQKFFGIVEHVASGKVRRFVSMEDLVDFMTRVLKEARESLEQADTLAEEFP